MDVDEGEDSVHAASLQIKRRGDFSAKKRRQRFARFAHRGFIHFIQRHTRKSERI
jgi:hypothetical protein